jgi:Sulfite exporter TauE/SafE
MGVRELPPFLQSVSAPRGARTSPVPFRGMLLTGAERPVSLSPKGSSPACTGDGDFLPFHQWAFMSHLVFALAIGLVSSLLGVAGGELIIPTFVFAFGADIKTAGTANLLVSLPTVLVGIARYANRGAYAERQDLVETVAPMGLGSVLGAVVGGMLVGLLPAAALKVILGIILIVSAIRIFHGQHAAHKSGAH